MPATSEKIQSQLGFPKTEICLADVIPPIPDNHPIGEVFALFPRQD
jgi:hypothetical protein